MKETTKAELIRDLSAMGINSRHVMVHSSYSLLKPVQGGPETVVDALVSVVIGNGRGCLLLPTFDFESWTERGYWDRYRTPGKMGIIAETARKRGWVRTTHPALSFVVNGSYRKYLEDRPLAHGAGSLFDYFTKQNGILLSIGAEKQAGFRQNDVGFTICNHAATLAGAPWRRTKIFEGLYVDGELAWDAKVEARRYALSVNADPSRYVTEVTPGHLEAERQGIIKRHPLGHTECWVADAATFVEWAIQSHIEHPELWRRQILPECGNPDCTDCQRKS